MPNGGPDVRLVARSRDATAALAGLDAEVVGVDVERADSDRYYRNAALVQVGRAHRCILLDGVRLDDLGALDDFLASRTAVFHAVENDLEPLAARGVTPAHLADTAVAAALLGMPTGLSRLLTEVLGVELEGDKSRMQRADWEARPLSEEMIAYAAGDVVHLPALWAELRDRLEGAGRLAWYEDELERVVRRAGEQTRSWTRVKGSGRLDGGQRAVLRAVWEAREDLARQHDIAPNRLIHDDVLRQIAETPPTTPDELRALARARRSHAERFAAPLLAAVRSGGEAPAELREGNGRPDPEERAVFDALRSSRAAVAEELGIDAGVLCPAQPLWAAVTGRPDDGRQLCELAGLDGWRAEVLADPLWATYRGATDAPASPGGDVPDSTAG